MSVRFMHPAIRAAAVAVAPLVAAALCLAGCVAGPVRPVAAIDLGANAAATLTRTYDDYFEEALQLTPTLATAIGDDRYDDVLENTASAQFWNRQREIDQRYLQRVEAVPVTGLSPAQRISRDVFVRDRRLSLEGQRFPERLLPIDQMDSMAATFAVLGSGAGPQPFRDTRDYDRFLARSRGFVQWADSAIDAMREGLARGVVQPQVAMVKVLPQLRELASGDVEQSVFWQPIKGLPDSVSPADRQRLTAAYREAIGRDIMPAYRRLADFVERDYLPRARTTVAWSALPDGQAWYQYRIRTQTTTDLGAHEIHAIGLAEVARIRAAMQDVLREVGFAGDLSAFFKYVQTDDRFFFSTPQQLIDGYRELKTRIDALLPQLFSDFPKANYEVRAVEPFRAASAAGASYMPASADGRRPGVFYINTRNLRAQPRYGMETLSLHEASPGHHFQVSIQQELGELPRFRRFRNNVAYAEGWALYAESIGKELGLFTDPWQWYGRLSDEMLRAMRLVVDTGLHAKGWSRERAIQYMRDNSSMAESDVVAEVERYIVWPGQALGYKVGQLRITALRAKAQQRLGAAFDVKEFHSQVLRDGALPLAVLEAKIDRWIDARAAAAGTSPAAKASGPVAGGTRGSRSPASRSP